MPRELAEDPEATVFEYGAGISVPHDWEAWGTLCRGLAEHLVERYGIDEVAHWGFEVWNEANLEVFWTGTRDEYFKLYDLAVEAVKSVDARLLVGGPATAAAGWIPDFLDHVVETGAPLDFLTTHTYGNLPLDVRESLRVRGLEAEVWWTEWGVTPTHFYEISDSVFSATFLLHGMKSAQERADALAYWVVSDHFEELGRPPALLHGGFGLLTVGNLRKPRWWALALAEQLGDDLLPLSLSGDGAGTLVDGWAARGPDGSIDVLLWNATLDQSKASGEALLDRTVTITGLPKGHATLARVDEQHSNLARHWRRERPWPTETELAELRANDRLHVEDLGVLDGSVTVELPMPGIARLRLAPAQERRAERPQLARRDAAGDRRVLGHVGPRRGLVGRLEDTDPGVDRAQRRPGEDQRSLVEPALQQFHVLAPHGLLLRRDRVGEVLARGVDEVDPLAHGRELTR